MIQGYVRVSSKSQEDNNSLCQQEQEILERYNDAVIHKEVYTAAKNFDNRSVFNDVIERLQDGDILVVCKMDRFCRNTREGIRIIEDLLNRNIKVHILAIGLIDNSPMGKLIYTIVLSFAEFERNMIIERTSRGREIARQRAGYREGRPNKYSKTQIDHAMRLLEENSYTQVNALTGISKSTLQRAKKQLSS